MVIPEVPYVEELLSQGLATVVGRSGKGEPTHHRLTTEGQRVVYAAMHARAARAKIASMRALDPEGTDDMTQQHQPLRPEITVAQCPLVNQHGTRCTQVEGHAERWGTKHNADVTFETYADLHRRMIESVAS